MNAWEGLDLILWVKQDFKLGYDLSEFRKPDQAAVKCDMRRESKRLTIEQPRENGSLK